MAKRGNNEGYINLRKDGRWEARYTAGYDASGAQIRRCLYASTQEEITKKLREVLRQLDRGEYADPSVITVSDWLDTWFNVYGRPRWRESTAAEHYRNINNNLKPGLGRHKLQKLRPDHIQAYINRQTEIGRAPASVRKQLEPLKASLKQAAINNLITRDPSLHLSLPVMSAREIDHLTIEEQKKLAEVLPQTTAGRGIFCGIQKHPGTWLPAEPLAQRPGIPVVGLGFYRYLRGVIRYLLFSACIGAEPIFVDAQHDGLYCFYLDLCMKPGKKGENSPVS